MSASWVEDVWLSVDCETTGVDVFSDRIVEVAVVQVFPDGTIGDTYSTVVDPGVDIPDGAAAVHGITTARAREEGVAPIEALQEVARRIFEHGHRPVIGFNMRFDWPLLVSEAERHGVEFPFLAPVLDPFLIDRMMEQYRKGSRKLVAVAQHYAVELDEVDAHGALADATAAARVMRAIIDRYPQVGEKSLASVYLRQVRGHERWREGFVDWKHRNGDPDFTEPPGWPIPALVKGGLPVVDAGPATAEVSPPAHEGDGTGEEATASAGAAAASPSPDREYGVTETDVAKLAGEVFRPDYDAAPRGQKSKAADRLRHAVIYAQTGGSRASLTGLPAKTLVQVHYRLRDIAEGRMSYQPDDQGVTFLLAGSDKPVRVDWARIDAVRNAA